jgi:hypothetical protein
MSEEKFPDKSGADEKPMLEAESKGSVRWGAGQVVLLHALQLPVAAMTIGLSLAVMSVSQLIYVIPALIIARRKGHEDTVKGIIIAASVTTLLSIACTGYVFYNFKIL